MLNPRIRGALVALAASAGLAACTNMGPFGGVGVGVGSNSYCGGLGGYGCNSPYYGYGSPYGYGYNSYYGGYPYYGWYNGFYYPGSGYWVYDPDGHPSPITEDQRSYWGNMLTKFREKRGATAEAKANFSGFRTRANAGATIAGVDLNAEAKAQARAERRALSQIRAAREQARTERSQVRVERQESMRDVTQERREARRARRSGGE